MLSQGELVKLTGRRRPSAQIRWLSDHHWAYAVDSDGNPVVAAAEFEAQMCTGATRRGAHRIVGPNFAALDRLG